MFGVKPTEAKPAESKPAEKATQQAGASGDKKSEADAAAKEMPKFLVTQPVTFGGKKVDAGNAPKPATTELFGAPAGGAKQF